MKNLLYFLLTLMLVSGLKAQQIIDPKSVMPFSAEVTSLFKFTEIPVSYNTGIPQISVPLYTIAVKDFEFPISLDYHAGGIRVTEAASRVGMGWALRCGGVITCSVRGLSDRGTNGRLNLPPNLTDPTMCELVEIADGRADSEPDMFYFNFGNKSGQFVFDANRNIIQIPEQGLKIETCLGGYKITDIDGSQYIFDKFEHVISVPKTVFNETILPGNFYGPQATVSQYSHYLSKIVTVNQDTVEII